MTILMQCWNCKKKNIDTYHFNEDGPCPRCNAGAYSQSFHEDSDLFREVPYDHPHAILARHELGVRRVKSFVSSQSLEMLVLAQELINKEIRKHHQVTYIQIEENNGL